MGEVRQERAGEIELEEGRTTFAGDYRLVFFLALLERAVSAGNEAEEPWIGEVAVAVRVDRRILLTDSVAVAVAASNAVGYKGEFGEEEEGRGSGEWGTATGESERERERERGVFFY
jgi:hypothetical protein